MAPAIQGAFGAYAGSKLRDQAAKAASDFEAADRAAAQAHLAKMPRAQELQGPPAEGEVMGTVPVTPEQRIQWANEGRGIPSLRQTLNRVIDDQLINEPVRADARAVRKEEKAEDIRLRRDLATDQLKQREAEARQRSEDVRYSAEQREAAAREARAIQLEIARMNDATRRDIAAMNAANRPQTEQQKQTIQKITDAKDVVTLLNEAEPFIDKATSSYVGAGRDILYKGVGASTEAGDAAAQLKAIQGALISKMPKMTGPQSDRDVALYREMAGQIGDPTVPVSQKRAAMATIRRLNEKYLESQGVGIPQPELGGRYGGGSIKKGWSVQEVK